MPSTVMGPYGRPRPHKGVHPCLHLFPTQTRIRQPVLFPLPLTIPDSFACSLEAPSSSRTATEPGLCSLSPHSLLVTWSSFHIPSPSKDSKISDITPYLGNSFSVADSCVPIHALVSKGAIFPRLLWDAKSS